jgi:hypothetical protein
MRKKQGLGNKLLPKARKMVLVGYSDKYKAWKCIDTATHQIVFSPNVVFNDEKPLLTSDLTNIKTLLKHATPLNSFEAGEADLSDQGEDTTSDDQPDTQHRTSDNHPDLPESNQPDLPESNRPDLPESNQPDLPERNRSKLPESIGPYEANKIYKSSSYGKWKYVEAESKPLKWDPELFPEPGQKRNRSTPNNAFASWLSSIDNIIDTFQVVSLDEFNNTEWALFANSAKVPNFTQAINGSQRIQWTAAIQEEYKSLKEKHVFSEPCLLPKGFKTLDTKLVLKLKEPEGTDSTRRYKARLCVRGFRQEEGIDFDFTFAPVATYHAVRLFLSIMASLNYELHTVDVKTAFLHAVLKETIYIRIPDGFDNASELRKKGLVIKLLKCLYGLKQSPMEWNSELDSFIKSLGFNACETEPCLYIHHQRKQYLLIYVDDFIIATRTVSEMIILKKMINTKYPLSDKGPINKFLNMDVTRNRITREIYISVPSKIENVCNDERLHEEDFKLVRIPSRLPATPNTHLKENSDEEIDKPFKGILGQLLYIAITCRPDIMTSVSLCGRHAMNPSMEHWNALLKIVSYLGSTRDLVLRLGGKFDEMKLTAFSDSDWAGDLAERKSRSGYLIQLNSSSVIWSSKLQTSVALSSTEAEYVALSLTSRDVIWLRNLLKEMGFAQKEATIIFEDNESCIKIAISSKQLPGTKHIDIRHHFIRQRITNHEINLESIRTNNMVADVLTKPLPVESFKKHIMAIGMATKGKC